MLKGKTILAIIPARGGSKRIPGKNIKLLAGKPLLAWTIETAKKCKLIDRLIVSTDSPEIAKVAQKYGAEIPFLRPKNLATDKATTRDVVKHAIIFLQKKEGFLPDLIVLLQPNSPFLQPEDIELAILQIEKTKSNSCFSVKKISERPEWMYTKQGEKAKPFLASKFNLKQSQALPEIFVVNGAVYVVKTEFLLKNNEIVDLKNTSVIAMPKERSIDIDTPFDFTIAALLAK